MIGPRDRSHSRYERLAVALVIPLLLLSMITIIPVQGSSAASPGFIGVSGTHLTGVGSSTPFVGVDDTIVWADAIEAYVNGNAQYWGRNMNFPGFNSAGRLGVDSLSELWYSYFWFCDHYGLAWVRMQNGDTWSSQIAYEAWRDHPTQFYQVLDEMLRQANAKGIHVTLTLAGGGTPMYDYGGSGSVYAYSIEDGSAYQNYLRFVKAVIAHCDASPYNNAIFTYDVFNEPDSDSVDAAFWHEDKEAFNAWANHVADDTTPLTSHIVEMGTACGGQLFNYGQGDFDLCTGDVGFDVAHVHLYGSAESPSLVTDRLTWASDAGKPLNVGEVGKNDVYPMTVWPWFQSVFSESGGAAFAWMDLVGIPGYPYSGSYPAGDPSPPAPTIIIQANRTSGERPLTVAFTSTVTDGQAPFSYQWSFGDGSTASAADPVHVFTTSGVFEVRANVSGGGNGASNVLTITVTDPSPPPETTPPTIQISANRTSGTSPFTVSFGSTVSEGQAPYQYQWDFGDGTTSTLADPDHTFLAGTYSVIANVSGGGNASSNALTIVVKEPDASPPLVAPVITISANRTNGTGPLTVAFLSNVTGGQAPFVYEWSFGDGTTSSEASPVRTFAPGIYHVHANVTGGGSASSNVILINSSSAPFGPGDSGDVPQNQTADTGGGDGGSSALIIGVVVVAAVCAVIAISYSGRFRKK